jgi:hypothetical protein
MRQSQELFRKIKDNYARIGPLAARIEQESSLRAEFENGSRIVCLPGKESTVRGYSDASLLIIDEASRVEEDLYQAVRPMLAVSGGRLVLLSTPFGKRGFFFREWTEGGPDWWRVRITAEDCPRISSEWLSQERAKIGDWWFAQEYSCEFVDTQDQVFAYEDIMAALDPSVTPLFGNCSL